LFFRVNEKGGGVLDTGEKESLGTMAHAATYLERGPVKHEEAPKNGDENVPKKLRGWSVPRDIEMVLGYCETSKGKEIRQK